MGLISPQVEALSNGRHYDMYFLTDVDIPFVQDGTRDGEHIRHDMHKRFHDELKKRGKPYISLPGSHEVRLKKAIEACNMILSAIKPL
jgi:nicotinamide riboside kinase